MGSRLRCLCRKEPGHTISKKINSSAMEIVLVKMDGTKPRGAISGYCEIATTTCAFKPHSSAPSLPSPDGSRSQ